MPFALETYGRLGCTTLKHLRNLAKARAQDLPDGGHEEATAALLQRWAARLSVALHRSNAARLRSALGEDELAKLRGEDLAAELAK